MMRSTLALGLALALVLASILLVDPFGWLEHRSPAGSAAPEAPAAEAPAEDEQPSLAAISADPETPSGPRAERRAVDAEATEALAVFRLLGSEGQLVSGATVVIARGEELLHFEISGEEGQISVPADGEAAELAVRVSAHPLELWHVRLETGLHELRYPERAHVAGRIELEDGAPAAGLRLRLDADAPMLPDLPVPQVVWDSLNVQPRYMTVLLHDSSDDGGFTFAGLPADWSGVLRMPRGWRLRSASQGELEATPGRLRLEAPTEGLLLRVAAPATLRGRLVHRSDGRPLAGATLSARLQAPGAESPEFLRGQADDAGRFELSGTSERIVAFDLRLGGTFQESPCLLALEVPDVPQDGDLGDVLVDDAREIPFLLRSPLGEPIVGGRARAGGTRSPPTGEDGRSVLRWVPLSISRLRAEASGFVPAEVELTPGLPDPLVIVLEPACRLEVLVLPPAGGDPDKFRVVLRREEGVVAGPCRDQADQTAYVDAWAFPPVDLMQAPHATFLATRPVGKEGMARFHALQVDVPIELEVRGITGKAVYYRRTLEPFHAGERRRIEVALGGGVVVFRGRVLDADGQLLERATVQLGGQILGWTDEQGAFLCFLTDPEPSTLLIQHSACSTLFLHDYVIPPGGREVEFRLQPARQVTIEVVDEAGQPMPQAEVWIRQEGFITNTHRIEGSRHKATSLTDNPFEIEVRVGGRRYLQEHTSDLPEARVVVPVHGSVVARVSAATTGSRTGRLSLVLQPAETEPTDALVEGRNSRPGELTLELTAVLPGRYEAYLMYEPTEAERAAGGQDERCAPVAITVEPASPTEIRLDLD